MRFAFLVAGLGLLIGAPLHAQPILVPMSPQPQRQPPGPPPPSPVPVAPGQSTPGAGPRVVFNGGAAPQRRSPARPAYGASGQPTQPPAIAAPPARQ